MTTVAKKINTTMALFLSPLSSGVLSISMYVLIQAGPGFYLVMLSCPAYFSASPVQSPVIILNPTKNCQNSMKSPLCAFMPVIVDKLVSSPHSLQVYCEINIFSLAHFCLCLLFLLICAASLPAKLLMPGQTPWGN